MKRLVIQDLTRADVVMFVMLGPDGDEPKDLKRCRKRMRTIRLKLDARYAVGSLVQSQISRAAELVASRCSWCKLCKDWDA